MNADNFDEEFFKKDTIPIPKKTYIITDDTKNKFIENLEKSCEDTEYKDNLIDLFRSILENTVHIDFRKFLKHLKASVETFEKQFKDNRLITNKDFILYVPHPDKNSPINEKSNYWVSQLVYHLLKIKPMEIVSKTGLQKYYSGSGYKKELNILICDDGSFSGKQMSVVIEDVIYNPSYMTFWIEFHIILPFITKNAKKRLMEIRETLKKDIRFKRKIVHINIYSNYEIIKNEGLGYLYEDEYRASIYFDHKIPDDLSTFSRLYSQGRQQFNIDNLSCIWRNPEVSLITKKDLETGKVEDCIHNSGYGCPKPTYKNRNDVENVKLITPDDYIGMMKTIDGKKSRRKSKKKSRKKSRRKKSRRKRRN